MSISIDLASFGAGVLIGILVAVFVMAVAATRSL